MVTWAPPPPSPSRSERRAARRRFPLEDCSSKCATSGIRVSCATAVAQPWLRSGNFLRHSAPGRSLPKLGNFPQVVAAERQKRPHGSERASPERALKTVQLREGGTDSRGVEVGVAGRFFHHRFLGL